jgi:hypothetical protein
VEEHDEALDPAIDLADQHLTTPRGAETIAPEILLAGLHAGERLALIDREFAYQGEDDRGIGRIGRPYADRRQAGLLRRLPLGPRRLPA